MAQHEGHSRPTKPGKIVSKWSFARIGLLGNPSDGYGGRAIAFTIRGLFASVVVESRSDRRIAICPNPEHDGTVFSSMTEQEKHFGRYGHSGGIKLLRALMTKFNKECRKKGVQLDESRGFNISYSTNIPRQVGLAGSSAIITAGFHALLEFYDCHEHFPRAERPEFVLSIERDVGIVAGMMDRVIQEYEGMMYMDFSQEGGYERLDPSLCPPLVLVISDRPSESGSVHSNVKKRWEQGDPQAKHLISSIADLAREGKAHLANGDATQLASLMDRNFDSRRELFGDSALGEKTVQMIELAHQVGASAKLPGSGGSAICLCPKGEEQEKQLRYVCEQHGFQALRVQVQEPQNPQ